MQNIYFPIGQNIRRKRKENHLTQEALSSHYETQTLISRRQPRPTKSGGVVQNNNNTSESFPQ